MSSAVEIVQTALGRLAHGRPTRPFDETDDEVSRLASDLRKRIAEGGEVRAWQEAGHRFREMPDREACEAVRELAINAPRELLRLFSEATNPLAVHALSRWIGWPDDLAQMWIREAPSRAVAALGLVGWLERDLAAEEEAFKTRLTCIGTALRARPREEEVALWWQLLGIAHRICRTTATSAAQFETLYRTAADGLGRTGGADALPTEEALVTWSQTNRQLLAVIPYVVDRAQGEPGPRLLGVFFADIEKRLGGELHEIPDLREQAGLFHINACGYAIALELPAGQPPLWWERSLNRFLSAQTGWRADLTAGGMERPAWIACATAIACVKLASVDGSQWRPVAEQLFGLVEPFLDDWLWHLGYPSSARTALPELLARLATLGDVASAAARVKRLALAAPDAATLAAVLRLAPTSIVREFEQLHAERVAYESALEPRR